MTSGKRRFDRPRAKEYLAGAALADGLIVLVSVGLPSIELSEDLTRLVMFLAIYVSTAIAGFVITRKVYSRYLTVGLITGMLAYVLYTIPLILVFPAVPMDFWLVIAFFLGGGVGAQVRQNRARRTHYG